MVPQCLFKELGISWKSSTTTTSCCCRASAAWKAAPNATPAWNWAVARFSLPVVPANMKTVVDETICAWLAQNGYFYVMHRFDLDNVPFVQGHAAKGCSPLSRWA